MALVVQAVKTALGLDVLNYQYGYITELNETLQEYSQTPEYAALKYPLVWLAEPFAVTRIATNSAYYGRATDLRLFVVTGATATMKAEQRHAENYEPILRPIYRELIKQIQAHKAFDFAGDHRYMDRYYWGDSQQSQLTDIVDVIEINSLSLNIYNNPNCLTSFNPIA